MIENSTWSNNNEQSALQERVLTILERLETVRPSPVWEPDHKPVDVLVGTILSQNTSDTNTDRAFKSLRETYPSWFDVLEAPVEDVVEAIRSGGLAQQKAPRIQNALKQILDPESEDPNKDLLDQLNGLDPASAMAELTKLPGVGPKTAACVLLFAVGMPVVPVDTHVYRVSHRIGLIGPRVDANRAHYELVGIVAPDDSYRFHVQFIYHGRMTCHARNPRCHECVLLDLCDYGSARMRDEKGGFSPDSRHE